ncbi:MAG: EF-hand domain-containing protein [Acidobacteria bacterium]|nr:EF-hand domain-containing protein [Acidobacteriota bacterium]
MKQFPIIAASLFTLVLLSSTFGQTPDPQTTPGRRPQRRDGALKRLDTNNDSKISRDEWQRKPQAFDKLDSDNDGFLTREELSAAVGRARQRGIQHMDANSDSRISRDEWKGNPKRFDRLDTDKDGMITQEELDARRPRPKK